MIKYRFFKWIIFLLAGGLLLLAGLYAYLDAQQEPLQMNEQARAHAPGQFVQLSRGITHYRLLGPEAGELLVLIHGGMVSGMHAWEPNQHFLAAQGYRVLMYDLYGRGYSDRIKGKYTPELLFQQFEELLTALEIQKPFYLAGLSLGSMVAINHTRRNPEQVKRLMLISPAARGKFTLHPALKVPVLSDFLLTTYWRPQAIQSQMNEFYQPEKFPEYRTRLEEMARYRGYKAANYSTWVHTLTYNMEGQLAEIGAQGTPVLLLLGAHDPYLNPDEALAYEKLIPGLEVKEIAHAGHIVNYEQASAVNQLMLAFFSPSGNSNVPNRP